MYQKHLWWCFTIKGKLAHDYATSYLVYITYFILPLVMVSVHDTTYSKTLIRLL